MPVLEIITSSGFGSLLGMRHALEPDHLAAVSTLVSRERNGYKAALLGACWGLGHTCRWSWSAPCWCCCARKCRRAPGGLFEFWSR